MTKCELCNGTGNAHHGGIANDGDEDSGCLGCGGAGYTSWQNTLFRVVFIAAMFMGMAYLLGWMFVQTYP